MDELQERLARLPFASVVGTMFAAVAVILVTVTPPLLFEHAVVASGLPLLFSAANPPLGEFARILAILAAATIAGALAFGVASLIERTLFATPARTAEADAHDRDAQSAFPRRPLFADRELGAPLMSDAAFEHARDELVLDSPLIDAEAIAPAPEPEPEPKLPTVPVSAPLEMMPIGALVARLEAGIAARPDGMPPLATLAKLGARA